MRENQLFNEKTSYQYFRKNPISDIECFEINYPKTPKHEITFINRENGHKFKVDDIQLTTYKRNQMVNQFFEIYGGNEKYSIIESSFLDNDSFPLSKVISGIKSKVKRNGNTVFGYIWIIDVGANQKPHFHFAIAIEKTNTLNNKLPEYLKLKYKGKKIYSSFVRSNEKYENYLKSKRIYERGSRKRTYGKSIRYKTI